MYSYTHWLYTYHCIHVYTIASILYVHNTAYYVHIYYNTLDDSTELVIEAVRPNSFGVGGGESE